MCMIFFEKKTNHGFWRFDDSFELKLLSWQLVLNRT